MAMHRLLPALLLFLSVSVVAQNEVSVGVYSGFGLRKRNDRDWNYQSRYGWEAGSSLQFRGKGGKTIHEWSAGLDGSYFHYTSPKAIMPSGFYEYYENRVRMFTLEGAYRFHRRVLHRERLDLYLGCGFSPKFLFLYRNTLKKHEEDQGVTYTQKWREQPENESVFVGVSGSLSLQYRLTDRFRLSMEANAGVSLELDLMSPSVYTAQNVRLGLLFVFPQKKTE